MSQGVFFMICGILVLRYANNWRGMIAVTMVATISAAIVFPPPAFAQFGLLGSIQNIISIINGTIQSALNAINGATEAVRSIHDVLNGAPQVWRLRSGGSATSQKGFYENFLGGRDDFLGGTAREFKRFRKAAGGFTINSVGTRLREAHQDLAGFRKRSRREGNSVRNEPA